MAEDPKLCTTSGSPITAETRQIDPATGMQKDYIVLCPEERAKGFVRPYRDSYKHVGQRPRFPLSDLTPEQQTRYAAQNYVKYEKYLESELPLVGKFWTQAQLSSGCGSVTTMGRALSETYAREPGFYGGTFCCTCGGHFPVAEFVWTADGQIVGS